MLNDRQQRFAIEYCVDFNATQAAIRAGYSPLTSGQIGHELLKNLEIQKIIEARKAELAAAARLTPEWVLEKWMALVDADPRELAKVRRVNCRYCHGFGENYQWTEGEYRRALDKAIEAGKPAPDASGGFGFNHKGVPKPGCPECAGEGIETVFVQDTDKIGSFGRRLFAGVKMTKDGVEVKLRDQDKALENLARYLGMNLDRKEISGSIAVETQQLTDDQLLAIIGQRDD